jgi:hypothetical protein
MIFLKPVRSVIEVEVEVEVEEEEERKKERRGSCDFSPYRTSSAWL